MRSAQEWSEDQYNFILKDEDGCYIAAQPFLEFIRAIQADALKAAADAIEGVGREGCEFAPKIFWETLRREQRVRIMSLIRKDK